MRLDKWLQVARVFKTRSQAGKACKLGRVEVNGARAKPHRPVAVDDRIEVRVRDRTRVLVVRKIEGKPVPKAVAPTLFDDASPPPPAPDPTRGSRGASEREAGAGRPTKRDRRLLDRLRAGR